MISQPLTIIRTNKMGRPYVQSTDPSLTRTMSPNDLWLNISEGTMKMWDGTGWVEMQFGESAIMDDCITNRMLANDISASKIVAGILRSQDGSFYLNLETGEAELLKLIMGGEIEGNIIATSSNGLTRVRLRGKEGDRDVTAGVIFEERESTSDDEAWANAGQIYFGYTNRNTYATFKGYEIGPYNSSRPIMGYNSGSNDGLMWRVLAQNWLRANYLTYHGVRLAKRETTDDSFENINPVIVVVGQIMSGTAVVGTGTATLTYKMNEIIQIDFNIKVTTSGSGTSTYGISTALLRTLSDEIPSLTPVDGGVLTAFNSSGALTNLMGASFLADGAYWKPAYVNNGVLTGINESSFTNGMTLSGTCYGKYVFED